MLQKRRTRFRALLGVCLALAWFATTEATAAERAKKVLIVHSFGSAAPPFTTVSTAFETELTGLSGQSIDLDQVSLDHARYAETETEEALVQYLQKRHTRWQPDLVVPIGSPAATFVANYRKRLFPSTPVLYTGMDPRRLPAGALESNAAFLGKSINGPGFIEDILQIAPATTNIVCVIGNTTVEQFWTTAFQRDFAPFTNHVRFTWLNDLSFDQMLEALKKLPQRSFILFTLLLRDAAGVTYNADEALRQIHDVANAPVNGIFEHQLGLGIVGGRLSGAEAEGRAAAQLAIRILRGEPTSNFPSQPPPEEPKPAQYDARELQRWNIPASRLPPGSILKYRAPTPWQRHRTPLIIGVSALVVQAALIAGLMLNLGRRRKAESSLRESEERMKLATSAAELGMWEWDFATNKVRVDGRRSEEISRGDSNYSRFLNEVHPEDRESVAQALTRAITGDGSFEHVHRHLMPDGRVRWIAARARVAFDAEHKPIKMHGVAMDITARKVAEDRARESERQFLLIANSSPVLMWTTSPDKLCDFVNQRWLDFKGRTLEQELGYGWAEGIHPEDLANCLKTYNESFDARRPFTLEYRMRRHDGQYRWISDHGVPRYDENKNFLGYIGSCVDETERKEAAEAAQRSERELEHVSRISMLAEMAGSLAHELNQPLAAVVSNAEAAQRFLENGRRNDQEVREALQDIAEQGQRAGEIIAGMRAMLKRDSGHAVAQDLNLVINEIFQMLHSDLVIKRVTPVLRLDPLLPPVEGHSVQLRQVVMNLVINACDAMSDLPADQRQLTIETRRATADEVEVSVADTGTGFSREMLKNPFEPFRTTKSKGLGLGLVICRSIIAAHGGRLMALNNGSRGAVVRFMLPARNGGE